MACRSYRRRWIHITLSGFTLLQRLQHATSWVTYYSGAGCEFRPSSSRAACPSSCHLDMTTVHRGSRRAEHPSSPLVSTPSSCLYDYRRWSASSRVSRLRGGGANTAAVAADVAFSASQEDAGGSAVLPSSPPAALPPEKKGFFGRFGGSTEHDG